MTENIGFIGLGNMGFGMAQNLLRKGFKLTIVGHVRKEPVEKLAAQGARVTNSPKEVAEVSDVILTSLPSQQVCEEVILGKNGVLEGAKRGMVIIQTSTVNPSFVKKLAEAAKSKGVDVIEAPIMGGRQAALAGTLHTIVGGDYEVFERCRKILEAFSRKISYVGGLGAASTVKLINNLCVVVHEAVGFEAVELAAKAGVNIKALYEIIKDGTGNSFAWEHLFSRLLTKQTVGVFIDAFCEVTSTIIGFAEELDVPVATAKGVLELFQQRYAKLGKEDLLAVIKYMEDELNLKIEM